VDATGAAKFASSLKSGIDAGYAAKQALSAPISANMQPAQIPSANQNPFMPTQDYGSSFGNQQRTFFNLSGGKK
jgi:hypothetical protein